MYLKILVNLDDDQVKDQIPQIANSVQFAIEGALHEHRDGSGRHSQTISYEVQVEEYYGANP